MSDEQRMYQLLETAEQHDEMTLSFASENPEIKLVNQMVMLGFLEDVTVMFGGRVVKLTAKGLQALAQARVNGIQSISLIQKTQPIQLNQTVHGTANTQIGDHNTMHVAMANQSPEKFIQQLTELRTLAAKLPTDDQEEALSTIASAQKAAEKGLLDRVKTYGPTLLALGTGTVEFAEKVKALFGL